MSNWKRFAHELKAVSTKGFAKPGPFFYFVSIIVVAGGVGIWLPWVSTGELSHQSIVTYIFALLAAVIADFMTQEEKSKKYTKDMTVFIFAIVVLVICITVVANNVSNYSVEIISCSLVLLWWLWWILLEDQKFDLQAETVEKSTIGSIEEEPDSKSKSLAALKASRLKERGEQ